EALLLAGEQAADPADHAIVAGSAPPGRVLRLQKDFTTPTSPVCPIGLGPEATCPEALAPLRLDDMLDTTMVVPADGRFTWHVGPSTRPWEHRAGRQEAWMLTCETPEGQVLETQAVTVWRGETAMVDLACDGSAPASAPKVSETPPDPASVAFEERLSELTAGAPAGARLTAGDVLTTRAGAPVGRRRVEQRGDPAARVGGVDDVVDLAVRGHVDARAVLVGGGDRRLERLLALPGVLDRLEFAPHPQPDGALEPHPAELA